MRLTDAEFQKAILEGNLEALEAHAEASYDESADDAGEESKVDVGEIDNKAAIDGDTKEGGADKEVKPDIKAEDVDVQAAVPSDPDTVANEILGKLKFDDEGNAIIPKALLALVSKDGKHEIPYGVLEATRNKAKESATELEQERNKRLEAESRLTKFDREQALLKKQLTDAGVDPEKLPEDLEITPELLESLSEYGDIGKVLKALIAKQGIAKDDTKATTQAEVKAEPDPRFDDYKEYVTKNPEFKAIMDKQGSDEQETLEHFYTQVSKSTEFKNKPLSEQLDEVWNRTCRVLGVEPKKPTSTDDEIRAIAEQKAKEVKENSTPSSPSEVGLIKADKGNAVERAKAAVGSDLLNIVGELSPEQIEALLDGMD